MFIDLLGFGMILPLLPVYAREFAQSERVMESGIPVGLLVGVLMSSFSAMQVLFSPIWGRLSDRFGRRPILMIGLGTSVVFYTMLGVATGASSGFPATAARPHSRGSSSSVASAGRRCGTRMGRWPRRSVFERTTNS